LQGVWISNDDGTNLVQISDPIMRAAVRNGRRTETG